MASIEKSLFTFIIVFLSSLLWPTLPSLLTVLAVSILLFLLLITAIKTRLNTKAFLVGALCGFIWACSVGYWYSSWQLPNEYINRNVIIEGYVTSTIIQQNSLQKVNKDTNTQVYKATLATISTGTAFSKQTNVLLHRRFTMSIVKLGKNKLNSPIKVQLSWYSPQFQLQQGNKVKLLVTLLPSNDLMNKGVFSHQKAQISKHIWVVGKVRASPSNQVIDSDISFRQYLVNAMVEMQPQQLRWILALSLGERSMLTSDDWDILQRSGTAHLFAISGMHLGIVSALVFLLSKRLLSSLPTLLRIMGDVKPSKQVNLWRLSLLCSFPFCFFYAMLSGFQVPVIRALIALSIALGLSFLGLHWRVRSIFLFIIAIFILLFPFSLLSISFWFSFSAVSAIFFWLWRFQSLSTTRWQKFKQLLLLQLFLSFAMLPVVASQFGIISLVSPIINLLMLPIVSLLLVPLGLIAIAAIALGVNILADILLSIMAYLFDWVFISMQYVLAIELSSISSPNLSFATYVLILVLFCFLALPSWPKKSSMITLVTLLLMNLIWKAKFGELPIVIALEKLAWQKDPKYATAAKQTNESEMSEQRLSDEKWVVVVADIGQGLSVLVMRQDTLLIYDSGPRFGTLPSLASRVLPPYLDEFYQLGAGLPKKAILINSHYDNDHAGGNTFLVNHYPIDKLFGPDEGCNVEQKAKIENQWQGLKIDVLWPLVSSSGNKNNESCVLRISDNRHTWLLTGDIEESAERDLLKHYANTAILKADFMVSPHHGSKTSSSKAFMQAVRPRYVFISAKYFNHWGFPHSQVLETYEAIDATIYNTAIDGAIRVELGTDGYHIDAMRRRWSTPWYLKYTR